MKNLMKALLIVAWIWLPTGPSDLAIIPGIVAVLGYKLYVVGSVLLLWYLYTNIDGKSLFDKLVTVKKEALAIIT